jgi:hypothetical protein
VVTAFTVLIGLLFEVGFDAIEVIVAVVSWIGPSGTGIGLGIFTLVAWIAAIPEAIAIASHRYGRVAFTREYARARGFGLESPQSFHRRLMRVELPAPAEFVLRGELAGRRRGRLVLCRSKRAILSSHHDAVVIETDAPTGSGYEAELAYAVDDGHLVVSRSSGADRSAADLDGFVERAVELHAALERGSIEPQTVASSTSPSGS